LLVPVFARAAGRSSEIAQFGWLFFPGSYRQRRLEARARRRRRCKLRNHRVDAEPLCQRGDQRTGKKIPVPRSLATRVGFN